MTRMTAVLLDTHARAVLDREAVSRRLRETGGALFGWRQDDHIIVACASGPGPGAQHRLRSFQPAPGVTATLIRRVRHASVGRYGYLGSWHTHPLTSPRPSGVDTETARAMADQKDLKLARPLLLILSTTGTSRRVAAGELRGWVWSSAGDGLVKASVESVDLQERYCPPDDLLFAAAVNRRGR